MNKQPLLSICIPTRNRADVLGICLDSIVNDPAFTEEVEIIVSDNCSNDGTHNLLKSYTDRFNNVKYFRNDTDIGVCRNIEHSLDVAQGEFLKLNNDYSVFKEGSLHFLVETVRKNRPDKPVLYFRMSNEKESYESFDDFDSFLNIAKWSTSWIGSFGYWKEDFQEFEDRCRREKRFFVIIDWLIRSYKKKRKIVCANKPLTTRFPFSAKQGGYNFIEIHTRNFLEQYEDLVPEGLVKNSTLENIKKEALMPAMVNWAIKLKIANKGKFSYDSQKSFEIIKREFGSYSWYKKELLKNILGSVYSIIKSEYIKPFAKKLIRR